MPRSRPASSPRSWPITSLTPSDGTPAGPPEPRLGVELASEVFQAAVDLDGDHAVAGAEPAGDAGGGLVAGPGPGHMLRTTEVISMPAVQPPGREPRPAPRSALWQIVPRAARALRAAHDEQVRMW